jgi:uncharacterized NAD(P)/FAD-binding protein YdhS
MQNNIGIIGGGLAGTAAFVNLVGKLTEKNTGTTTITIFEPATIIGPGMVYRQDLPDSFILNHENRLMGTVNHTKYREQDTRTDFFEWLKENATLLTKQMPNLHPFDPEAFSPRKAYGMYLAQRYREAKAFAEQNGITVKEVHGSASAIRKKNQWIVDYEDSNGKQAASFQQLIVSNGHFYRNIPKEWQKTGRAFQAYPPERYITDDKNPRKTLLIRGAGLTAVDAAIVALESGQYTHVMMISRHGQLHALRGKKKPYTPQYCTLENLEREFPTQPFPLDRFLELLKQEIEEAYKDAGKSAPDWEEILHPKDMRKFLKTQLDQIERGEEFLWRSVFDAVDTARQSIYSRMTPEDQARFQNEYRNLYISYRAAMPPENGVKLLHYMEEGKLTISGGLLSTSYNKQTDKFEIEIGKDEENRNYISLDGTTAIPPHINITKMSADTFVDAVGQSRSIPKSPLLNQMVKEGIAKEHALGGLHLGENMEFLDRNGQKQSGIYALGNMSDGQHINHSSSLNLCDISRNIAKHVAQNTSELPQPRISNPELFRLTEQPQHEH